MSASMFSYLSYIMAMYLGASNIEAGVENALKGKCLFWCALRQLS